MECVIGNRLCMELFVKHAHYAGQHGFTIVYCIITTSRLIKTPEFWRMPNSACSFSFRVPASTDTVHKSGSLLPCPSPGNVIFAQGLWLLHPSLCLSERDPSCASSGSSSSELQRWSHQLLITLSQTNALLSIIVPIFDPEQQR